MKRFLWASALLLVLTLFSLSAKATPWPLAYVANAHTRHETTIRPQAVGEESYLFLPSSANLSALSLSFASEGDSLLLTAAKDTSKNSLTIHSGKPFDLLSLFPGGSADGVYAVTLTAPKGEERMNLLIMASANIGSVYLTSDDPIHQGREWMDSKDGEEREPIPASMVMLGENGTCLYDGRLREIRGRGNTSWSWGIKKPYQLKLDYPADLLQNGDPANRTWVLLAESFDATLLHNSLSFDLGQELGLSATPQYTPIDLYYDGEYRGTYLLAEKAHVNPGRLAIWDYEKYIEALYETITDIHQLPVKQATNDYGHRYQYIEGLEVSLGAEGAYLLELDNIFFQQEKCWFTTDGEVVYVAKSPALLSQGDMVYLSCFMQELEDTLQNHGVHPVNGKSLEAYLDIPSFVDFFLVQTFAKNCDFWHSSTFFYLPVGENRLYAGPLWDFDVAYAMRDTRPFEGGVEGFLPASGWIRDLMKLPVFQEAVLERFVTTFLPLLTDILPGDESARGKALRSLDGYLARIGASEKMNYILWETGGQYPNINKKTLYPTFEENIAHFRDYLTGRTQWLTENFSQWAGYEISRVWLTLSYRNANIPQHALLNVENEYNNCTLSPLEWQCVPHPENPAQTLYTVCATLTANEGSVFSAAPSLLVNGYPVNVSASDEKTLRFEYTFSGPTFAPALYDDVDYSLIYQYDYFLQQNPEVIEECGTDPADVLEYYVYYGIGYGLRAISTFDADAFIANYEKLMESYYMCDVEMSTLHYLEHAYEEDLLGMAETCFPPPAETEAPPPDPSTQGPD